MNLAILSLENPPFEQIEAIAAGGEEARGTLLQVLRDFLAPGGEDVVDEQIVLHAVRILSALQEIRALPLLAEILEICDEDDDESELTNDTGVAIESFASPEHFEILWALFQDYRGTEAESEILMALAECGVPDSRLRPILTEFFRQDPERYAHFIQGTRDPYYLQILEEHLRSIAPIAKYLPYNRLVIYEHGEWTEVGGAWAALKFRNFRGATFGQRDLKSWYSKPDLSALRDLDSEHTPKYQEILKKIEDQRRVLEEYFCAGLPAELPATPQGAIDSITGRPIIQAEAIARVQFLRRISDREKRGFVIARKIGRNDPCPCMSGKKHKRCCGAT